MISALLVELPVEFYLGLARTALLLTEGAAELDVLGLAGVVGVDVALDLPGQPADRGQSSRQRDPDPALREEADPHGEPVFEGAHRLTLPQCS